MPTHTFSNLKAISGNSTFFAAGQDDKAVMPPTGRINSHINYMKGERMLLCNVKNWESTDTRICFHTAVCIKKQRLQIESYVVTPFSLIRLIPPPYETNNQKHCSIGFHRFLQRTPVLVSFSVANHKFVRHTLCLSVQLHWICN
jgi:hypothetical protein